jgi:mono/diheme cytochrome c family protein
MRSIVAAIGAYLAMSVCAVPVAVAGSASEEAVKRGEQVYSSLCWTCHGRYGRGDGPAAEGLAVRPPDFTNSAFLAGRSNSQIVARLRGTAHTPMAIASVLKEEALRDAISFIRTLSVPGKHVSLRSGRDIYNGSCWVCHGSEGNGAGPASHNMDPAPRDFTSPEFRIKGREQEIYRIISLGPAAAFHGAPYMPEWGSKLSPQQIRDVVEYLKTFQSE